ncbi:thiol reductant ABC exporter subunit CydD [Dietzia sp. UBA5065]|mgnify:FL=1|uniref:thiol reductant ABC exporter subunit CydD n=1 Tax=Dietzia sp. UBA5065 TaxID=1946422 RepID=UPI0025BAC6F1|nr:thiol reductant ABC exporter subunit CydD [Dietzia sp. UBA5065]HMT50785.1 thiol reductant ABC exporter subunit CydD [Dietzia sp.]
MATPLDPRLVRESRPVRRHLAVSVALAVVTAAATAAFAVLLARVLAGVITDPSSRPLGSWSRELAFLAVAAATRVAATWAQQRLARAAAGDIVDDLRGRVARAVSGWDPIDRRRRSAELHTVLTTGLAGLVPYLAGYVPALATAVVVTPALLVVVAFVDPLSAVVIAVTLPLIPVFMILVGTLTRSRTERELQTMSRLSARVLDLIAGLPTLVALGRERGPEAQVAAAARAHRRATMGALRIAFLSSMVLELLATLCVALVAVGIGLRLVVGDMELAAGIAALVLAPEVYQPLRTVGARFHESSDGALAADRAFEVLHDGDDGPGGGSGHGEAAGTAGLHPDGPARIQIEGLGVRGRDGPRPDGLDLVAEPGRLTVLTGPNGSGKSTAVLALLGLLAPARLEAGRIRIGGIDIGELDRGHWWSRVAWQPQRPTLVSGTLRQNVELFGVDPGRLDAAARQTGFDAVLAGREAGWDSPVGHGGRGLSTGEAHRLALTRLFASDADVLVSDEPTAHLDEETAGRVVDALRDRARSGDTVLVVTHSPLVLAAADVVVGLTAAGTPGARAGVDT